VTFVKALEKFSIFSTYNVDEAESILAQSLVDAQVMKVLDQENFELQLNTVNVGKTTLVCNRYGSYTEIKSGESGIPEDSLYFIMGNDIASEFRINEESFSVSQTRGVLMTPMKRIQVKRQSGSEILILRASLSQLRSYYELLSDKHQSKSLEFESDVDLKHGIGAILKQIVTNFLNDFNNNADLRNDHTVKSSYDKLFLNSLLLLPHSLSKSDQSYRNITIAPKNVIRAEEYMRAHLSQQISINELIGECGCSRNALFASFRNSRAYTPMAFLTEQRLLKARRLIQKSDTHTAISTIARDCGFLHLPRFSQAYRKRFGELPSETIRKRSSH
jgi:AraC-like DNA-binding protein